MLRAPHRLVHYDNSILLLDELLFTAKNYEQLTHTHTIIIAPVAHAFCEKRENPTHFLFSRFLKSVSCGLCCSKLSHRALQSLIFQDRSTERMRIDIHSFFILVVDAVVTTRDCVVGHFKRMILTSATATDDSVAPISISITCSLRGDFRSI